MEEYIDKAKRIIEKLENAGVDVSPVNNNFMQSHIPVGPLKRIENGIEKEIYGNAGIKPFSMYVHIPFCENNCSYCMFCKKSPSKGPVKKYLDSLLNKEFPLLEARVHSWDNLRSVYIGGGTPTILEESYLERLLGEIRRRGGDEVEIEIEANPNALTDSKMRVLKNYRVNRLSIGVQSFNNQILESIKTNSDKKQARASIEKALKNFDNVNIDLIYGLPFQNIDHINDDIDIIKSLDVPSVTWYQLWTRSRYDRTILEFFKYVRLSKEDIVAAKLMINYKLTEIGYLNFYNDWYLKSQDIIPRYETFAINAQDNVGLGISPYLFVEPYIFENTNSFNTYFDVVEKGKLPIEWYRKMNEDELEVRKLGMIIKTGKMDGIDLKKIPGEVKRRIKRLVSKGIIISKGEELELAPDIMPINKDYIAKYLLGEAWWIRRGGQTSAFSILHFMKKAILSCQKVIYNQ